MAKRPKRLAKRIYTYKQLEKILVAYEKNRRTSTALYGSVLIRGTYSDRCSIEIAYATDRISVPLARVYRAEGEDTVYVVLPPPDLYLRSKDRSAYNRTAVLWKRYIRVFTPHDEARVFSMPLHYRVSKGVATEIEWPIPGFWQSFPRGTIAREPRQWATEFDRKQPSLARRARLFATRLRKAMSKGPPAVVQVFHQQTGERAHIPFVGPLLHVCTAPTQTQNGKRLVVKIGEYNDEGQLHHHVDDEYARKHSQFFGVEEGKSWKEGGMRWKCSTDAITGIAEWVLGNLYDIPGP